MEAQTDTEYVDLTLEQIDQDSSPPPLMSESSEAEFDAPPPPPAGTQDPSKDLDALADLHAEAVAATWNAVRQAEANKSAETQELGRALRAEQEKWYQQIIAAAPAAVKEASAKGHRVAVLCRFDGADKFEDFCYLYMLKGPYKPEYRAEMRDMGAKPLLPRFRNVFHAAGFGVYHAWQRATNENTFSITW